MRPFIVLVLATALLLPGCVTLLPATSVRGTSTAGPLAADAGSTQVAAQGESLPLHARVAGGSPPYAVTWSVDAPGAVIDHPHALEANLSTTGLPPGDVTVHLAVGDAAGATASDEVLEHVAVPTVLLQRAYAAGPGVPDEAVASGAVDHETRTFNVTVPAGLATFTAVLNWSNRDGGVPATGNDLDLYLVDPAGHDVGGTRGATSNRPEVVTVSEPANGTWQVRVEAYLSAPDDVNLTVAGVPGIDLPRLRNGGDYTFGSADAQRLVAEVRGGQGTAVAWDLDGNGTYSVAGANVTAHLPPGNHTVWTRVTDGRGYRVEAPARVRVVATAQHALALSCGGDAWHPLRTMEYGASLGTCWMHIGHHTYDLGSPVALRGGWGRVFSVEQQFSPPSTYQDPPFTTPLRVQTSLDGLHWRTVGNLTYRFLDDPRNGSAGAPTRQAITFELTPDPHPLRFLRISEPPSAAQGLSGYLDASDLTLLTDPAPTAAATANPPLQPGTRNLTCAAGDIMEAFFTTHPCTFGGVDRYDSPSVLHTYPLGGVAHVASLRGNATFAPWRSDDWIQPLPPTEAQATTTTLYVQVSADGTTWRTVATVNGTYGRPIPFQVDQVPLDAAFVRLHGGYHVRYGSPGTDPSLHHLDAYLLASDIQVTGDLPRARG